LPPSLSPGRTQSTRGCQIIKAKIAMVASRPGRCERGPGVQHAAIIGWQCDRLERRLPAQSADTCLDAKSRKPTRNGDHKQPRHHDAEFVERRKTDIR